MKKLGVLGVLMAFFLLGNFGSLVYVIFEKDQDRVWACVPVIGFFIIGGCITGMIMVQRDRKKRRESEEW